MINKELSTVDKKINDSLKSNSCQDVAVITVIKDESCYIHEWIHHYLYFGFKHIYLGVNRTTDKTIEVLDAICSQYSNVKYFVMDWIDKDADKSGINPSMQGLSFSFLANEAFRSPNVSHCLSVDADEFFYPTDFKQDISQFINSMPYNCKLSIHWACQEIDERPFSPPFENKNYYTTPQVKTIISREAFDNLRKFTLHVPLLKIDDQSPHIDASGEYFKPGKHREISEPNFNKDQNAFILHRMIRSEVEYLALLLRKRPSSALRVKDNRDGIIRRSKLLTIDLNNDKLQPYYRSLDNFIVDCNLGSTLTQIRNEIVNSSREILTVSDEELLKYIDVYYKVLQGTSLFSALHERVKSMDVAFIKTHRFDVNKVRELAIKLESKHIAIALDLMKIALIKRPEGPVILSKISEYEAKIG